jgi:aminoglycoside phosphotransferase
MPNAVPVMKRSNGPPLRAAQTMDRQGGELRQQHELNGDRQPFGDRLQHRLPGAEGTAEITLHDMAEPDEVALPDRQVQSHVMPQRSQVLRRRLIGKDRIGKIARQ